MSDVEKIRVGDEPLIKVTITEDGSAVDVSGVTTKQIKLQDPSGNTTSNTADFTTDGTDGVIEYQVTDGEIDERGQWKFSGFVEDGAGRQFESEPQRLLVEEAL